MKTNSLLCALALLACTGTVTAEGRYNLEAGVDFSRGDYGTDSTTDIWSVPLTLSYSAEAWGWSVSMPWLVVRGTGEVVPTGPTVVRRSRGGAVTPDTRTVVRTESGVGDVSLRASLRLREESDALPWTGVTAKAKIATADESRGLGTGENDYALQLDLAKGPVDGFVGYRLLGDPPGTDFRDTTYGSVAVSFDAGPDTRIGADVYAEEAALAGTPDKREASLFLVQRLSDKRRINAYVLKGFSDASPDWGIGIALSSEL